MALALLGEVGILPGLLGLGLTLRYVLLSLALLLLGATLTLGVVTTEQCTGGLLDAPLDVLDSTLEAFLLSVPISQRFSPFPSTSVDI